MEIDLQINAAHVIPVIPENQVSNDTSIIVKDGRILDILPIVEANKKYSAQTTHSLDNHILMPGLVNAHTHAAMNLLRGYADDMPLMSWLKDHIWPAEQKWLSSDFVFDGALMACAEMLRGGTTCFADMYFFPESTARAAEQSGIRATIGLISLDLISPPPMRRMPRTIYKKGYRSTISCAGIPWSKPCLPHMDPTPVAMSHLKK